MQLGVIGLGTMGANLARNAASRGAHVVVYNRTTEKTLQFMDMFRREGDFTATQSLKEFVAALKPPRPILLMVKAGTAVDAVIEELLPLLSAGDMIIDAGNSLFTDTARRESSLKEKGLRFVGMGVSGGEEGALRGPSIMPGGDKSIVKDILPLLKKMAASDGAGGTCVEYIGPAGAGHFVKMVHNGIEYGMMQALAELYDCMRTLGKFKHKELADIFDEWKTSKDVGCFLVEITASIFRVKDPETKKDLLDVILDTAGQKGTGKWTTESAMNLGVAIPTITSSVDARILSGDKDMRGFGTTWPTVKAGGNVSKKALIEMCRATLELTMILDYIQGFELIRHASDEHKWNVNNSDVARIWRGGCIIRSNMLPLFQKAVDPKNKAAAKQLMARFSGKRQKQWRELLALAAKNGIPTPTLSATLAYYDSCRQKRLPTNLIQAQRDFFGAHTYQRVDKSGTFHTDWSPYL
jgi:6-phosphogluconate dehydrogenase